MLTFPLGTGEFFDWIPIASLTFDCPERVVLSQTEGGDLLPVDVGPRLWQGTVVFGRITPEEAAKAETILSVLRSAGRSFMAYDVRRPFPAKDPTGSILGAAGVTIQALAANNREMALAGLPSGYRLSVGDYLSFGYGSNPGRRALHRVVSELVTAGAGGTTPLFEVEPFIRPGAVIGQTVTLRRPPCRAVVVPGSTEIGLSRRGISEGTSFRFLQSLRF